METVLIVDDEINYPKILSAVLDQEGYETITANSGGAALQILGSADVDLVLTDMKMPGMDGIELLEKIKAKKPDVPVIMMTAHGTVEKAVEAMEKGAYTYILKPFDNSRLILYVNKATSVSRVLRENRRLRHDIETKYSFGNIIGKSKAMEEVYETIRKVAPTTATILIEGESGTGKELVAKSIHYNSTRTEKPFIAVNCSALSESLLESELFGHEKGAFTGAATMKKGRFEMADGGTLFLDEIGELSHALQVKLLRVIQEKTFERVGGTKPIKADIRLIAATNRSLKSEIEKGTFREDLYYRLNVVRTTLPPLRERKEDIRPLVFFFMEKYSSQRNSEISVKGLSQDVERIFNDYNWPGNVRELENVIERAMILSPGEYICVEDLPKEYRNNVFISLPIDEIPPDANLYDTLAMVEKKMIERALFLTGNIQSHAAKLLGIGKSGLNQKIKKHSLEIGSKS